MDDGTKISLEAYFGDMPDPRVTGRCDHKLIDIIIVAICAVLSGAETWDEVELFGEEREGWLKQFLELPNGVPSHDTFRRVFSLLDARMFQERFIEWVERTFQVKREQVIAIDGKSVRGSQGQGKSCLHLVSAWATAEGVALGQRKVAAGANEIIAIPDLLADLYLKGSIVTIDAIGCQKEIAAQLIAKQADYVLALKANQPKLHQDVVEWFAWAQQREFRDVEHTYAQMVNKGHGRIEIRQCWAISDPRALEVLGHHEGWAKLTSLVMVRRERRRGDRSQTETAYFISSLPPDAEHLLRAVRHHWRIENSLHWVLDVIFHEDDARLRIGDGAENFAILRRMVLNLLRRHPAKLSLKRKRFKAALDTDFLFDLLTQV
ncbi:MAG TPA: ISAs1 family transposase [Burkholderiaceae bacterium]|nr:ISAs1 family transposase [Burkholderiaceae bacterium]